MADKAVNRYEFEITNRVVSRGPGAERFPRETPPGDFQKTVVNAVVIGLGLIRSLGGGIAGDPCLKRTPKKEVPG